MSRLARSDDLSRGHWPFGHLSQSQVSNAALFRRFVVARRNERAQGAKPAADRDRRQSTYGVRPGGITWSIGTVDETA